MKFGLAIMAVSFMFSAAAQANDGGVAAIKVSEIKMRELSTKTGEVIKSHKNPSFKILINGGEAKKLQKILPSTSSVLTAMQPELEKQFNETFKTLGIYSNKSNAATSKVITISCNDGELVPVGETGKLMIQKKAATECEITINGVEDEYAGDQFGDMQEFNPKTCQ